ncbi:GAF domain-containing protein [Halorubellus sp. JP-L1]|uniref:bacterio-opsin activator domain-containing protein n=1 Tax=Halorubellus sp. JP-L1 TaxID=2715753 RepID=UPI001408DC8E|nr:bacterio-opsin activator domain-containing protein [Halorubellus sp. JP-L1]NHN40809.1 GAF domain-containing protein [Halorubellus sp. JP-L1]
MADSVETTTDLVDVLDAVPGVLAVQTGEEFAAVADELAAAVGTPVEDLAGARWETVLAVEDPEALARGERTPVAAAREDGSWTGPLLANDGEDDAARTVTLRATEGNDVVWTRADRPEDVADADADEERGTAEDGPAGSPDLAQPAPGVASGDAPADELARANNIIGTVLDGVYALDGDLRFTFVNEALARMFGTTKQELLGTPVKELFANEDEIALADDIRERVVEGDTSTGTVKADVQTPAGPRTLESNYRLYPEPDGEYRGSVGVIRDVTDREHRERALERRRDELETLDHINELLLETTRELVASANRDAVERRVCEQLASSDRYEFAWVGERSIDGERIVPRTSAGDDDGYLDAITVPAHDSETDCGPSGRAVRTGAVQVGTVDDGAFEPWQDAAAERGFGSVAAVPLHYDDTVYGVLSVYAADADAFTEREQAGFDVLGRTVGFVIHAVKSQQLLNAESAVELEFRHDDPGPVPARLSDALACTLELDGYVPAGSEWVLYFAVADATPEAVVAAAEGVERVAAASVVSDAADRKRVQLRLTDSSFFDTVSDAGAAVTGEVATDGAGYVTVELPAGADVRSVTGLIRREHPTLELAARRERDRSMDDTAPADGPLSELTDRQRQSLRAAYHAGYFRWPRESTAEEVADSLDVAAPTLHGHIRKAERAVFDALFESSRTEN